MSANLIDTSNIADIAVFRLDNLGDCILTSGLLRKLREQFPRSRLMVFAWDKTADYFRASPYVNTVFPIPRFFPKQLDQTDVRSLLDKFTAHFAGAFDLVINPRAAPDWYCAAVMAEKTAAPVRVAFRQQEFIQGLDPNPLYTHLFEVPDHLPMAEINLQMLDAFAEVKRRFATPEVWPSNRGRQQAGQLLNRPEKRGGYCALTIGAASKHKIWQAEGFSDIVPFLAREFDMLSVLIGTEKDQEAAALIHNNHPNICIDLTGKTTIENLIGVIERCRLYVGNDTGPKHIAAAFGMPVVEICALQKQMSEFPYAGEMYVAYGTRVTVLRPAPAFSREEILNRKAISSVQVEEVKRAILDVMSAPS